MLCSLYFRCTGASPSELSCIQASPLALAEPLPVPSADGRPCAPAAGARAGGAPCAPLSSQLSATAKNVFPRLRAAAKPYVPQLDAAGWPLWWAASPRRVEAATRIQTRWRGWFQRRRFRGQKFVATALALRLVQTHERGVAPLRGLAAALQWAQEERQCLLRWAVRLAQQFLAAWLLDRTWHGVRQRRSFQHLRACVVKVSIKSSIGLPRLATS